MKWKYKEGERKAECYDCRLPYKKFVDMVIPNDLWELINPSYFWGAGLLCPICAIKRLQKMGIEKVSIKI